MNGPSSRPEAKQKEKILMLVESGPAPMLFLVWITITQLIMVLHSRLFKRGTWYSHLLAGREADMRFACFEFCRGPSHKPAAKLLTALGAMMFDPGGDGRQHLLLLHTRYGSNSDDWPLALTKALHISNVVAFARVWRLLFFYFKLWPWPLARAYDPATSEEEKVDMMLAFLKVPKGSELLDPGLGRKVREIVDSVEDLQEPVLSQTLFLTFQRAVMTSTFVERLFKDLSALTRKPQTIATVGAKHCNAVFGQWVSRWRKQNDYKSIDPAGYAIGALRATPRPDASLISIFNSLTRLA